MKVTGSDSPPCFGGEEKSVWPPGFRFHPTDDELVLYYLKKKMCRRRLKLDIIAQVDVYKREPEELPGLSKLKTGDRQWFFFSPRDRKYPNGARANRATRNGYWKATGRDRTISCNSRSVGVKKTLVFYIGRAPNGERTDWVMHEYTMDENELKRCPNVQDYYALYKVFKKSGPGPKNGEQYGAIFKEEDWADEDELDVSNKFIQETPPKQLSGVISVDISEPDGQESDVWDEIWNGLAVEPPVIPTYGDDYVNPQAQAIGEEEAQRPLVDSSFNRAFISDPIGTVLTPSSQQYGIPRNVDLTQSTSSHLQLDEAPEVTSASNITEQERGLSEEDFLEIDDLLVPETVPTPRIDEKAEDLQSKDDGLWLLDLYDDTVKFLRETVPLPYLNTIENEMVNRVDNQIQPHSAGVEQISSELWTLDQGSVYSPSDSIQGTIGQPTSGVVYPSSLTTIPAGGNQNTDGEVGNSAGNLFTSALWSFVESIPTTPASASDNALVNRALVRMSSFSRLRMNALSTNACNECAVTGKAGKIKGGLIMVSVIVALIAILWVLILGPMKILGRCLSS